MTTVLIKIEHSKESGEIGTISYRIPVHKVREAVTDAVREYSEGEVFNLWLYIGSHIFQLEG